jgi:hypothetical protein
VFWHFGILASRSVGQSFECMKYFDLFERRSAYLGVLPGKVGLTMVDLMHFTLATMRGSRARYRHAGLGP